MFSSIFRLNISSLFPLVITMVKKKMVIDFEKMPAELMQAKDEDGDTFNWYELFRRMANQTPNFKQLEIEIDISTDPQLWGHCQRVLPQWIKIDW